MEKNGVKLSKDQFLLQLNSRSKLECPWTPSKRNNSHGVLLLKDLIERWYAVDTIRMALRSVWVQTLYSDEDKLFLLHIYCT